MGINPGDKSKEWEGGKKKKKKECGGGGGEVWKKARGKKMKADKRLCGKAYWNIVYNLVVPKHAALIAFDTL